MKKRAFIWGLVALAFILLFPFSASASVVDYVDLSPEQTLALYGNEIIGSYWNGSEYDACKFTYCYTFEPSSINNISFDHSNWTQSEKDYLSDRKFLVYEMDSDSATRNNIISSDRNRVTLQLNPTISISGIAYFRQFVGFSFMDNSYALPNDFNFVANSFSYSPSPVTALCKYNSQDSSNHYPCMFDLALPYDSIGAPPSSDSGISGTRLRVSFNCFDCIGQDIVDGVEQTFTLTSQQFSFNRIQSYGWSDNFGSLSIRDYHYFVYVTCPRLTEGYVLPDQPETTPNYGGQLDDINISIGSSNTLLQQILAKLDAIYAKMNSQGISISGTVEIGGPSITNIGVAIGNSVGAAIQSLFVPTQADILNFRMSMSTLVADTFAPFEDAESVRDDAFRRIVSASPTATLDLPLMDLRPTVDFHIPSETFTDAGFDVVDGKVKVPLKPNEEDWGFFYELLAWAIDIVCTIAFINMIINKFNGLIVGKKVVEMEDDN